MATYDLGKVVGDAGEKGDDGSTVWNTSTAPTYANSKYTFNISNLSGKTGLQIAVNDIIFYSTYYYIVSTVNTTTVDCSTRVSIKGSDASVTIVDNLTSTSSTSVLSAKQGKVLNDNKIETSSIATSFGSTPSDSKVASEKLVKNSLDAKQATLVSGTNIKTVNNNSLLGSGNINIESGSDVDIVTSWEATLSDTKVPSEKLTKNTLDTKADASSLATVATTGDYDDLTDKPTIPSASTTTPSADTSSGSYGSGTSYARSNHTHPKSSLYAESSHTHTKSQITDFPSLSTVATSGSYSDLSNKPSYTATITSSTTGAYEIGKINVSGSSQTIYGKDTGGSSVDIVTAWESTPSNSKVPSEKLVYDSIIGKIDDVSESGDIFYEDDSNNGYMYLFDRNISYRISNPLVKYKGYEIANLNDIPTNTSDLTNDGADGTNVFVANNDSRLSDSRTPTSHTHGNLTNDGKVGSNANYIVVTGTGGAITSVQKLGNITYDGKIGSTSGKPVITTTSGTLTTGSFGSTSGTFAEGNHTHSGYISTSSTTGLVKNDGSIDTNTYLTSSAITGMLTSSDIANNLTTTTSGKVLDARQGKALADLIGQAITYINQ